MTLEPQIYIAIAIIVLAIIALFLVYSGKYRSKKKPSALAYGAIFLVIFSMFFDERLPAYSLIGAGVLLAVIDIIKNLKTNKNP